MLTSSLAGAFDPPLDGVYVLTAYGRTNNYDYGSGYIKNNDDVLCQFYIGVFGSADAAGCTVTTELEIGDSIRLMGDGADPTGIEAVFSGFAGHVINDNLST